LIVLQTLSGPGANADDEANPDKEKAWNSFHNAQAMRLINENAQSAAAAKDAAAAALDAMWAAEQAAAKAKKLRPKRPSSTHSTYSSRTASSAHSSSGDDGQDSTTSGSGRASPRPPRDDHKHVGSVGSKATVPSTPRRSVPSGLRGVDDGQYSATSSSSYIESDRSDEAEEGLLLLERGAAAAASHQSNPVLRRPTGWLQERPQTAVDWQHSMTSVADDPTADPMVSSQPHNEPLEPSQRGPHITQGGLMESSRDVSDEVASTSIQSDSDSDSDSDTSSSSASSDAQAMPDGLKRPWMRDAAYPTLQPIDGISPRYDQNSAASNARVANQVSSADGFSTLPATGLVDPSWYPVTVNFQNIPADPEFPTIDPNCEEVTHQLRQRLMDDHRDGKLSLQGSFGMTLAPIDRSDGALSEQLTIFYEKRLDLDGEEALQSLFSESLGIPSRCVLVVQPPS
jgi:hypothetical protein